MNRIDLNKEPMFINKYNEKFTILGVNKEELKNGDRYDIYLRNKKNLRVFLISGQNVKKSNKVSYAFVTMKEYIGKLPKFDYIHSNKKATVSLNYSYSIVSHTKNVYQVNLNNLKYNECRFNNGDLFFMYDRTSVNKETFEIVLDGFNINKDVEKRPMYLLNYTDTYLDKLIIFLKNSNLRVLDLRNGNEIPKFVEADVVLYEDNIDLVELKKNTPDSYKVEFVELSRQTILS